VVAASGLILGASYMLWLYQRIFFHSVNPGLHGLSDLNLREMLTLAPMVVLIFWIGCYPNALLSFLHVSVGHLLDQVHGVILAGASLR
jgi:NADH-quinone oxidoreductase subunit M